MEGKTLGTIGVVAVIVIAGAIGFAAWKFGGDEGEKKSDWTIIDSLQNGEIKGGLYYIDTWERDGGTYKNTYITAEGTTATNIPYLLETDSSFKNTTVPFSVDVFKQWYFDFTAATCPEGVTVTHTAVGSFTDYSITGKATIKDDYNNSRTIEFDDVSIAVDSEGYAQWAGGTAKVNGTYEDGAHNKFTFKGIEETYSGTGGIVKTVRNGNYFASIPNGHCSNISEFMGLFTTFSETYYSAITTSAKDVSYAGVDAREIVYDGTIGTLTYKGTAHHYKGYLIDQDNTINDSRENYSVKIYYL